jgi:hypothetical protein
MSTHHSGRRTRLKLALATSIPIVAGVLALGFGGPRAGSPKGPVASSPERAVEQLFSLALAGDCRQASELVLSARSQQSIRDAEACHEFVEFVREHPLEEIVSTTTDGRNPAFKLVTARLRNSLGLRTFTVSGERNEWKVQTL